jgi:hypothetical protein
MCKRCLIAIGALVTITCGGASPAAPPPPPAPDEVNLTGKWTGQLHITSFSGGGCYGAFLAASLAQHPTAYDWAYTETITQTGSVISAHKTFAYWLDYPETVCEPDCFSCESSGSILRSTYTLTLASCTVKENNAPCPSEQNKGIQRMVGGSQTGTVSGGTISGTGEETSNIFKASGDPDGVLTVRYSYTQHR